MIAISSKNAITYSANRLMTLLRYCTRSQPGGGVTRCGITRTHQIRNDQSPTQLYICELHVCRQETGTSLGQHANIQVLTPSRMGSTTTQTAWKTKGRAARMMSSSAMPQRLPNSRRHGMAASVQPAMLLHTNAGTTCKLTPVLQLDLRGKCRQP